MGLKEMQILFDNSYATYYAGSAINGRLVLTIDSPKKVREIKVKFKGEAEVFWSEEESRRGDNGETIREQTDFRAEETYLEYKYNLCGEKEFPPGTHTFNFSTVLPPQLPTSYEGEFGHIRYTVKVILDRPWKFDQECKAAFTVIRPVDLNFIPEARYPLRLDKEKTVGICCCKSGPLSATISAPLSGYTAGQTIPVTVEIENGTNTNVTHGSITLRKVVVYKALRPMQKTKEGITDIAKFDLSSIGAHGSNTFNNSIVIPPLPATNTEGCSIITINYELYLDTHVSGMFYKGLKLSAPVVIGTIPLVSYTNNEQPSNGPMGDVPQGVYPTLPPPSYEESTFGKAATIQDKDDNEHTLGIGGWVPRYPSFNYDPSAPPAQLSQDLHPVP